VTDVGIVATRAWLPERVMTAAEVGERSGIPGDVVVEKFGLSGKHVAGSDEHVSTMATAAGRELLAEQGIDPTEVDAVVYFGSTWKDHPVWQAAPRIAHELGCTNAFALELDYVSCGSPVAMRVCRDMVRAEPEVRTLLAVAACRESHLVDYDNPRARFTYNFADGAVATLLRRDHPANHLLGAHMVTDGSFSHHVKVLAGGSVEPASHASVDAGHHLLDVADPSGMKERLDPVTLPNFRAVAEEACRRSGLTLADVTWVCGIHMKRSIHEALLDELGIPHDRATYLADTGHMSGVDPLLALDREVRAGTVTDGDVVLLLAAGTGYTWAAQVLRWGPA
jgi:3-oxoacyl-[acyl-carrier-protein] synthase III